MSQPVARMKPALLATLSVLASGALHGLLLLGLIRSASGAESTQEELTPARFAGDTFEIETVVAPAPTLAGPAPEAPGAPAEEAVSAPEPEVPSAPEPTGAPAPPAPVVPAAPAPAPEPSALREPTAPPEVPPSSRAPTPRGEAASARAPEASGASGMPPAAEGPQESGAAEPAASSGATYGQDALTAITVSFGKAFTRAVPRIALADKVWHRLPLGAAGSAVFEIELDEQGKVVGQGKVLDEPFPAQHLARIIGRTVLLLRNRTFAPAGDAAVPIRQRFELSAEIRQEPALDDTFAEPEDLRQIGHFLDPTRVRPGRANFTYNSGRQVELTLRLLPP